MSDAPVDVTLLLPRFELGMVADGKGNELEESGFLTVNTSPDGLDSECEIRIEGRGAAKYARLIAAAPKLLEVARLLLVFDKGNPHPEDEDSWAWFALGLVGKAEAAVAQAEGRQ